MKHYLTLVLLMLTTPGLAATNILLEVKKLQALHNAIATHCSIIGVSAPDWVNKSSWLVQYEGQPWKLAINDSCAKIIVDGFDISTSPTVGVSK